MRQAIRASVLAGVAPASLFWAGQAVGQQSTATHSSAKPVLIDASYRS